MKLRNLLEQVTVRRMLGSDAVEIASVTSDSRLVHQGSLFVAIPGFQVDGNEFIDSAIEKGAKAILSDHEPRQIEGVTFVQVNDAREACSLVAAAFHGNPASRFPLVGVTGTSGKTTTTKMLESIFDATGEPTGLIGTIEYRAGQQHEIADRTTPDSVILQEWLGKMVEERVRYAVMEVSSHALALKRTHGMHFAAAIFTNLSRDHFDFHADFEDYFSAKKILFDQIDRSRRTAVVNRDDSWGRRLIDELGDAALTFGRSSEADVRPEGDLQVTIHGLHGTIATPQGPVRLESALLGVPNLYNWLAAIGVARILNIETEAIEEGIRNLRSVRGRFERASLSEDQLPVIVDYAHKPDALEKLLRAVRELAPDRKLVLVVGCGGDRDKGKRPLMGEIAVRLADQTLITSDNPRSEKPEAIIAEMEAGAREAEGGDYTVVVDRREAIEKAIVEAEDASVVVIAGKGHEDYQVIGDRILHFDDREEARAALEKRERKRLGKK